MNWRLNRTATYWPPNSSRYSSISFPFSWSAQPGPWGASLCWDMVLIPASSLQLIWTSCRRGYIIILHPPTSCERHICTQFNPSTVKVIPLSLDIFDRMHLLFTQVHFSSDNPAGSEVNMLQKYNNPDIFCPKRYSPSPSFSHALLTIYSLRMYIEFFKIYKILRMHEISFLFLLKSFTSSCPYLKIIHCPTILSF